MKRVLVPLMALLMITPMISAGTIDGSTRFLLASVGDVQRTQDLSLLIMALTSASDDLTWNIEPELYPMVKKLTEYQNPDGGWGYFFKEPSNVISTAYAVVALQRSAEVIENGDFIKRSVELGVQYLLSARSGNGWGYVPETPASCYPTLMALWALGEAGYSTDDQFINVALEYLEEAECEIPSDEVLALKAIALHSLGVQIDNETVGQIKHTLAGDIPLDQRALLTYALVLVAPFDFDTYLYLNKMEEFSEESSNGTLAYWPGSGIGAVTSGTLTTTAFSLMALSTTYEMAPPSHFENPYRMPCDDLVYLQNPDGGWGFDIFAPSDEKVTYYAIQALKTCFPRSKNIEKALNWSKEAFQLQTEVLRSRRGMNYKYLYSLESMLYQNALSEEEKAAAVELIKKSQLPEGLWGHRFAGPQPYDTALAVKALLDLGVSPSDPLIQRAKVWLLDISDGGWGLYLGYSPRKLMFPDVLTTLTVLDALSNISTPDELLPHIQWLIDQRTDDGWTYSSGPSPASLELTVRITDFLKGHGYDYTNETLRTVMKYRDKGIIKEKPLDTAFAILYLSRFQYIPEVNLYDLRYAMDRETFEIVNRTLNSTQISAVRDALSKYFQGTFVISEGENLAEGNYIVIAGFEDYNISHYNPYLKLRITDEWVEVGSIKAAKEEAIVIVPGKTPEGVVLFVLSEPVHRDLVEKVFTTGFIRYLRGNVMVITVKGKEISLKVLG